VFPTHLQVTFYATVSCQQLRLRNDLYCVGWGVKLYSLTLVNNIPAIPVHHMRTQMLENSTVLGIIM